MTNPVWMDETLDHLIAIHHSWQRFDGPAGIPDKRNR
jgi:hypothetical protein